MNLNPNPTNPSDGRVADAANRNWVDRYAPPGFRPYLRLSRADRPIGTWLLLIPCWWSIALAVAADPAGPGWYDVWLSVSCIPGAFLMRGAGCTWNDLTDRKIDASVARTRSRPLPSGQVSPKQAVIWMFVQALAAFAILVTFPPFAVWLGASSLVLVAIYPFAKRFTWWPQVFLGLAFNWGALLGWAAHTGSLAPAPVLLYMSGIAWTLFYDTIYAHQDKEDDALIGVKSTARLFGNDTGRWLIRFQYIAVVLLALAAVTAGMSAPALFVAIMGVAGFLVHLRWQIKSVDINDTETCLRVFRSNRDAGFVLVLAFGLAAFL